MAMPTTSEDSPIRCVSCRSTQLHAEKRGFKLGVAGALFFWPAGFIGQSKIWVTCLKCGERFRPGDPRSASDYVSLGGGIGTALGEVVRALRTPAADTMQDEWRGDGAVVGAVIILAVFAFFLWFLGRICYL
jgi:hypothetical protein